MAENNTILQMDFTNPDGKAVSVKLAEPREDLTAAEVEAVMNMLNDLKVLISVNGPTLAPAKLKGAKAVETSISSFGITVA